MLLDAALFGAARSMSADGSIILGDGLDAYNLPTRPFIWDGAHGRRDLEQALRDSGADLTDWSIGDAASPLPLLAISSDGKVAVGTGTCGGVPALYRVVLPD